VSSKKKRSKGRGKEREPSSEKAVGQPAAALLLSYFEFGNPRRPHLHRENGKKEKRKKKKEKRNFYARALSSFITMVQNEKSKEKEERSCRGSGRLAESLLLRSFPSRVNSVCRWERRKGKKKGKKKERGLPGVQVGMKSATCSVTSSFIRNPFRGAQRRRMEGEKRRYVPGVRPEQWRGHAAILAFSLFWESHEFRMRCGGGEEGKKKKGEEKLWREAQRTYNVVSRWRLIFPLFCDAFAAAASK